MSALNCAECGKQVSMTFHGVCRDCAQDHFAYDDDDRDPEGPSFECAGFNDSTGFYCPLWGSEECDWECPNGGMA